MVSFSRIALDIVSFLSLSHSIVIDTNSGKIEGIDDEFGGHIFYNIPYAEPPIGDLRWKPTQPLQDPTWTGTFNGTAPGYACHQGTELLLAGSNGELSEDCLTLAIQTPFDFATADTPLRPVLFWLHGTYSPPHFPSHTPPLCRRRT